MASRQVIAAVLAAGLVIMTDQYSKWWAFTALRQAGGHTALAAPIDLTFNWNESNAFGLIPVIGGATRWVLMTVNLLVVAVLLHAVVTRPMRLLTRFGLALIMAGAVGNALDRIFYGAVVDFLDATKLGFPWIFNFADSSVDVGIALTFLSLVLNERRTPVDEQT